MTGAAGSANPLQLSISLAVQRRCPPFLRLLSLLGSLPQEGVQLQLLLDLFPLLLLQLCQPGLSRLLFQRDL